MKQTTTRKLWQLMKLSAFQGLLAIISFNVAIASEGLAQILDRQVTLHAVNMPLLETLKKIEQQTSIQFAYSASHIDTTIPVSIDVKAEPLRTVLNQMLSKLNITYKVYELEEKITLQILNVPALPEEKKHTPNPVKTSKALLTGEVKDATSGEPIAGVNIIVRGTTLGTSTDAKGQYTIDAEIGDVLVFSFIGYKSTEIKVSSSTTYDVTLSEDVNALNEVVVNAGYYEVAQKQQTGNIQTVTAKEISQQPVSNPLNALTGRMTGVYVQQMTGVPGGGISIQIRGQNSLRNTLSDNGNMPLYIIDGIPFTSTSLTTSSGSNLQYGNPLSSINPSDIESIDVLKDADATAIYGSRGANGVVLITTKKAMKGTTRFSITQSNGVGNVTRKMKMMNTAQYVRMRQQAFINDGQTPDEFNAPDLVTWDTTRYTDWQKKLIGGTARTSNTQLSLSGGTSGTQFMISGSHYSESSVYPGSFMYRKISGHSVLSHTSENKRFNTSLTTNFVFENNSLPTTDLTYKAINLSPNAPKAFNDDGSLNWENSTWENPYAALQQQYQLKTTNFIVNSTTSYRIVDGLVAKTSIGFTNLSSKERSLFPISSLNPASAPLNGSSLFGDNRITTWIAEPQLDYQKTFSNHKISLLAGSTVQESLKEGSTTSGSGYTSDLLLSNPQAAGLLQAVDAIEVKYRYAAFFGRINYQYHDKYIINLTARRDGSTRFGPQKRFASFGAIGAAWIFSEEQWMKNALAFLSYGKVRSSFGVTGSDQINDYGYLATYSLTAPYGGRTGLFPARLANNTYSWEKNQKFEAAIDLGFLHDRINLSVAYYRNRSSNQLVGLTLAPTAGFLSVQGNFPAIVHNTGVELQLTTKNISTPSFEWITSFNFTAPKNILVSYPNLESSSYADTYVVGESLYIRKFFRYNGLDATTGTYTFDDIDKSGGVSYPADITVVRTGQQYYGGVQNTFKAYGIELSVMFQFVKQRAETYVRSFNMPGSFSQGSGNQPSIVNSYWRSDNITSEIQKPTQDYSTPTATAYYYFQNSTASIEDASFIRLKNVSLDYQIPTKWTKKFPSLKIFASAQNLLTFTKYKGWDPESLSTQVLPPLRIINVGFQLTL